MVEPKTLLRSGALLVLGTLAGAGITGWHAARVKADEIRESLHQAKYIQTITLIRLCETLEKGDIAGARYGMEESLNANIAYMAPSAYGLDPAGTTARNTLQLAAAHRTRHPFIANNPCVNKMVANAFLATHWDGRSAPPRQVYWNE
jgi:hypothetical protein